jgi:hypothetical protein
LKKTKKNRKRGKEITKKKENEYRNKVTEITRKTRPEET